MPSDKWDRRPGRPKGEPGLGWAFLLIAGALPFTVLLVWALDKLGAWG